MNADEVMAFLVQERKIRGLRQQDIADAAGFCQQEVSKHESGRFVTLNAMAKYADALGYDLELSLTQRPIEDQDGAGSRTAPSSAEMPLRAN